MDLNSYNMVVSYDGTDVGGWQLQWHRNTVTHLLQSSFERAFSEKISLLGASRTDAGVHALGQVAVFKSRHQMNPDHMRRVWNNVLPPSIHIRQLDHASRGFHPHQHVAWKEYWYHLFLSRPLPHVARFGWHYKFVDRVDWRKFETLCALYVGTHDFRSFCKLDQPKDTRRTIDMIRLIPFRHQRMIRVVVRGKSFLRYQLRRMIGYALDLARRPGSTPDDLAYLLDKPAPRQILLKAPAQGLCLRKITYLR